MRTVTLSVANRQGVKQRALEVFSGKRRGAHISFASADLLWKVLTAKRWELLKAMAGGGSMTLRETARRAGRDVKAVHRDVHALLAAGVLRKSYTSSERRAARQPEGQRVIARFRSDACWIRHRHGS